MIDMVGTALQAFYLFHIVPFVVLMFFPVFFFEDYICFRCGLVRKFAEKKGGYGPWELVNYLFFFLEKRNFYSSL